MVLGGSWFIRGKVRSRSPLQPLSLLAVCFTFAFVILNLRHAPTFIQNLLPEGPSTCWTSVNFQCARCIPDALQHEPPRDTRDWAFDSSRDEMNYGLTQQQCATAFPGLFTEIEESVRRFQHSSITREHLDKQARPDGTIRAMIHDGQLYIIDTSNVYIQRFNTRALATLLSLNRAITAAMDKNVDSRLPNVEFVLNIDDYVDPKLTAWAYTRKANHNNTWLMPDFTYYSWPEPGVGAYTEVRRQMREVESGFSSFAAKIPRIMWRGAIKTSPRLRQDLLDRTEGQEWADVKALLWKDKQDVEKNLVEIGDHCKYMFIVHTEGRAYSGRLKYVQNCRSVIFAHDMQWIQPFEYLMVSEGAKQNYVKVERDFSDLPAKVEYYLSHQDEAERIAENSARTFRDRYLTPAAEACYWRKLIVGWSKIGPSSSLYTGSGENRRPRGVPFESYALMRSLQWDRG